MALVPPGGDPVPYNDTTLSFAQVFGSEYGLESGHWRQTITTGNAVTIHYFDARWRKRMTITYDLANPGGTQRMQRFDYDPYNRTTFAAYPARGLRRRRSDRRCLFVFLEQVADFRRFHFFEILRNSKIRIT